MLEVHDVHSHMGLVDIWCTSTPGAIPGWTTYPGTGLIPGSRKVSGLIFGHASIPRSKIDTRATVIPNQLNDTHAIVIPCFGCPWVLTAQACHIHVSLVLLVIYLEQIFMPDY